MCGDTLKLSDKNVKQIILQKQKLTLTGEKHNVFLIGLFKNL
jgi:hypothetical protein